MITKATQTHGDDNPVDKDEDLVQRFNKGDLPAFNSIHKQYFLKLYYFTFKLIKDDQEAKAIASETMEKLWKLRGNFETMADIRGFLYTVSNNAGYDYLKSNTCKKEILVADVQEMLKDDIDDENNERLNLFVEAILSSSNSTVEKLKKILVYLKDKNYQIDINELKNV